MPFPPNVPLLAAGPPTVGSENALPFRGLTLLLVEDSRFTCDALRLICLRAGGRLRRAETLARAQAYLARFHPDLVIVDLGLPDGRGEALIAELAAGGLPVLGMSGDPDGRVAAFAEGASGFVEKPVGSIAAFQALVLGSVGRDPADMPEAAALPVPVGGIDPQAYQDDLLRASDLIEGSEPVDAGYAASFLRSLGRAAGDDDLERAAAEAQTAPGRAALARMLQDRLRERNGALGRPVL
ncbi:Signal transduction response regulator, receiver domain [Paracoccaceae bacterium]|jgi:CheY-like chemotaxis protein